MHIPATAINAMLRFIVSSSVLLTGLNNDSDDRTKRFRFGGVRGIGRIGCLCILPDSLVNTVGASYKTLYVNPEIRALIEKLFYSRTGVSE